MVHIKVCKSDCPLFISPLTRQSVKLSRRIFRETFMHIGGRLLPDCQNRPHGG